MENLEVVFRFRFPFAGRLAVVVCFERHVLPSFLSCVFINFCKAGWPSAYSNACLVAASQKSALIVSLFNVLYGCFPRGTKEWSKYLLVNTMIGK